MNEPAAGKFQCLNRLCRKVYRHVAEPFHHHCDMEGCDQEGTLIGHLLAHSCPHCGSIYTESFDRR